MSTETLYDCAIVGGGLGGLCLSIQLAQNGFKVILFEKETYPFHKVCGEYISLESKQFLSSCGIYVDELQLPIIKKLQISAPSGYAIQAALPLGGFGISRFTLDQLLVNEATKLGVTVMQGTKVSQVKNNDLLYEIHAENLVYNSRIVAGSYGKRSNIDIQLKRNFIAKKYKDAENYIGIKYHIKLDYPIDLISLHNFKDGYCGISKVDDDRYCLCYLTNSKNLKENGSSIQEMEKNVLMKNPFLKEIFDTAEFLYKEPLSISQIHFEEKEQVVNGIFMVGDAAGIITPLCGNGMSMAMHASKIFAGLATIFLDGKMSKEQLEIAYTKAWRKEFAKRVWFGRQFQKLFGDPKITEFVFRILKWNPALLKVLITLTHGKKF